MKILLVVAHPVPTSFNHAIRRAVTEALTTAGHEVRVADLCAEGFQPAMIEADFAQFRDEPMPPAIQAEQERVVWSEAMVFVFPVWWWSMPGVLKGWIDRVMAYGFAWKDPRDPRSGGLGDRRILTLATAGDDAAGFAKRGYDTAFDTQLRVGTWEYCGGYDSRTHIFHSVVPGMTDDLRRRYLDDARRIAVEYMAAPAAG